MAGGAASPSQQMPPRVSFMEIIEEDAEGGVGIGVGLDGDEAEGVDGGGEGGGMAGSSGGGGGAEEAMGPDGDDESMAFDEAAFEAKAGAAVAAKHSSSSPVPSSTDAAGVSAE